MDDVVELAMELAFDEPAHRELARRTVFTQPTRPPTTPSPRHSLPSSISRVKRR
jgi:hypothetical protein